MRAALCSFVILISVFAIGESQKNILDVYAANPFLSNGKFLKFFYFFGLLVECRPFHDIQKYKKIICGIILCIYVNN